MFWRVASFLLCQTVPALAIWVFYSGPSRLADALLAALVGCYGWLLIDALRSLRLLKWLRSGRHVADAAGQRALG